MTDAKTGANREKVCLGISTADDTIVLPIKIDPISGGVIIDPTFVADTTPVLETNALRRDANRIPVGGGETDDASRSVLPLLFDSRNDTLWVDLLLSV